MTASLAGRARQRAPIPFEIIAVHLDQGRPGDDETTLEASPREQGFQHRILRGILYNAAQSPQCTKIALGHHGILRAVEFPLIPCNLCGSQENLWRQQVKQMLDEIETRAIRVRESILAAFKNVRTSHLLGAS